MDGSFLAKDNVHARARGPWGYKAKKAGNLSNEKIK
jgi:hypothetical protein